MNYPLPFWIHTNIYPAQLWHWPKPVIAVIDRLKEIRQDNDPDIQLAWIIGFPTLCSTHYTFKATQPGNDLTLRITINPQPALKEYLWTWQSRTPQRAGGYGDDLPPFLQSNLLRSLFETSAVKLH